MSQVFGNVTLSPSGIVPVTENIWLKPQLRLVEAAKGIKQMQTAHSQIDYLSGWTRFVDSSEEFWTNFYSSGKSASTAFQPWLGPYESLRSSDELLLYLKQARHQSQHGGNTLMWEGGHIEVGGSAFSGTIARLEISPSGQFVADVESGVSNGFRVIHHPPTPALPTIRNLKFKQEFLPPKEHLSHPILDHSPHAVALLALRFYEDVFRHAQEKFQK